MLPTLILPMPPMRRLIPTLPRSRFMFIPFRPMLIVALGNIQLLRAGWMFGFLLRLR